MYAVGHIALGYITGKTLGHTTHQDQNIPLLWALSLIPDIDLLMPFLQHRGPTHSIIVLLILAMPFFLHNPKKTLPYFAALVSHPLIGDYITGSTMLLWPISTDWIGYPANLRIGSISEAYVELILFIAMLIAILMTKDLAKILSPDKRSIPLFIPLAALVFPVLLRYPLTVPPILVIPHLLLAAIIAVTVVRTLWKMLTPIGKTLLDATNKTPSKT